MLHEMQVTDKDIFIDRPEEEDGFPQYQKLLKKDYLFPNMSQCTPNAGDSEIFPPTHFG